MKVFRATFSMIFVLSLVPLHGVIRTSVVASNMHYPRFIIALRNKTNELLKEVQTGKSFDVQDLLSHRQALRAHELTMLSKEEYFNLEKQIDLTFEQINREFIAGAKALDNRNAEVNEKREFIIRMSKMAQEKINTLLAEKAQNMLKSPANIDI